MLDVHNNSLKNYYLTLIQINKQI